LPVSQTEFPPSGVCLKLTEPDTTATSVVPDPAIMSTPWCRRPPERGAPHVSAYATAPCTGHTIPGLGGGGGAGGSGVGAGAGASPPALSEPALSEPALSDPPLPDAPLSDAPLSAPPFVPSPASFGAAPPPLSEPASGLTTPCGCWAAAWASACAWAAAASLAAFAASAARSFSSSR